MITLNAATRLLATPLGFTQLAKRAEASGLDFYSEAGAGVIAMKPQLYKVPKNSLKGKPATVCITTKDCKTFTVNVLVDGENIWHSTKALPPTWATEDLHKVQTMLMLEVLDLTLFLSFLGK